MQRSNAIPIVRWVIVALLVIGGLFFRLAYNANTEIDRPIRGDAAHYLIYAHNLLDHATFSKAQDPDPAADAYWAPGYPSYLAAIIYLSEVWELSDYRMILLSQALLGAGMILLTFLLGSALLPGSWPILPTALVTLSPHLISTASYVLTETLFGFLLLLSLYTITLAAQKPSSHGRWLLAGSCFSAAYLVNPIALLLPPLIALIVLWRRGTSTNLLVIFLLPLIVTTSGWQVRNAYSVAEGQPTSSGRLLNNLASGIYPDYHDRWRESVLYPERSVIVPGDDIESYPAFFKALAAQFQSSPVALLTWYGAGKPILLWSWDIRVGWGDIYIYRVFHSLYDTSSLARVSYSIMKSMHFWMFAATLLGMCFLYINRRDKNATPWVLYVTLLYVSGVYVCTQAAPRYSIPLRPEMYLAATYGLHQLSLLISRLRQ